MLEWVLKPMLTLGDKNDPEYIFLDQFQTWVNDCKHTTFNIFVFSLSEEPSLLSQWRSYTPHGKGVSIGFSPKAISSIIGNSNFRIAKCLYEKSEKEEALGGLVANMLETFRQEQPTSDASQAHPSQCYHPFLERFRGDVLQILSIIKHSSFKEEREWRLISPYYSSYKAPEINYSSHMVPEIKFREGASMIVPYIELPFGESNPKFDEIILGPSPHQNLSMQALHMYLSNQELCKHIKNCSIPYREW
jgi:hypothetical protein